MQTLPMSLSEAEAVYCELLANIYSNAQWGELSVEQIRAGLVHKEPAVRSAALTQVEYVPTEAEIEAILGMDDPDCDVLHALLCRFEEKLLSQEQIGEVLKKPKYSATFLMAIDVVIAQDSYRLSQLEPAVLCKRLLKLGEIQLIKDVITRLQGEAAIVIARLRTMMLNPSLDEERVPRRGRHAESIQSL